MAEGQSVPAAITRALRGLVTQNAGYKLASLLLALLMWVWVQGQQVGEQSTWIEVAYTLPEERVFNQEPNNRVRATLRGTQAQLRELRRHRPRLEVDLSEFPVGVQSLDFFQTEIEGLPEGVEVLALAPNTLQVELEPRWVRTVAVEVVTVGEVPAGYRVRSLKPLPDKVALAGPKSILETMDAVATLPVPLDGLNASSTLDAALALKPRTLSLAEPTTVQVSVEIEPITATRVFEAVPVTSRDRGWTPQVDTVEVTLSGPSRALEALIPEAVTVLVIVAEEATGPRLNASLEGEGGARLVVHHGGGPDIAVARLSPARVPLEPGSR